MSGGCCGAVSRRAFLRLMGLGAATLALPSPVLAESPEPKLRRLIERQVTTNRKDPWIVVHGIRAFGQSLSLGDVKAADYILTNAVRRKEVNGRSYLYVPHEVEFHTNSFLKTLLEAGVPLSRDVQADGRRYHLKDLADGARGLFTFDPKRFDKDDLAWSLIAFSTLHADEWTNVSGQRIRLRDLVAFGFQTIEEATRGMGASAQANRPLPQKYAIHGFTCGGTHLAYSLVIATKEGYADEYRSRLKAQLDLLVYRLWADPELMDRFYATFPKTSWVEVNRLESQLKFVGHAFEVLHYAKQHGLFAPTAAQQARMAEGRRTLNQVFSAVAAVDLKQVKGQDSSLASLFIGDLCHAYRGVRLA